MKLCAPHFEIQPRIPSVMVWWYHLDLESPVGLAFLKKGDMAGLANYFWKRDVSGILHLKVFWKE